MIQSVFHLDIYTTKMLLKVSDVEKHAKKVKQITNFKKVVMSLFIQTLKTIWHII